MIRASKYLLIFLLVLATFLAWITVTESGLRFVYTLASPFLPETLIVKKLEGKIIGPITVTDFSYQQEGVVVKTDQLTVDWQPGDLLFTRLNVNRLHIKTLEINLAQVKQDKKTPSETTALPDINLPWLIQLQDAQINGLRFTQGEQIINVNQIKLNASNFLNTLNIKEFSINADTSSLTIKGKLSPNGNYKHDLNISWQTELPSKASIKGTGQITGDIKTSKIKQQLTGPIQLSLKAELNDLVNKLNWRTEIDVSEFDASKLDASLPALNAAIKLDAKGDLSAATFALDVNAMDGTATANGDVHWSPTLSWNAEVNAKKINPAILLAEWPGQLSANIISKGQYEDGKLVAAVDINKLDGILREYPVSLKSHQQWKNETLNISQLDFYSGKSHLNLQGEINKTLSLKWSISSDNLAELYPLAKGQLHADGQVNGSREVPVVNARVNAKELQLSTNRIASLEGTLAADIFKWQQVDINLTAKSLNFNNNIVETIELKGGSRNITAKAITSQLTTIIELEGEPYKNGWRGQIKHADIETKQYDNWLLLNPVAVDISSKPLITDKLCWSNKKDASLCVDIKQKNTASQISIVAENAPLLLLNTLLPPDMKIEGVANATAELEYISSSVQSSQPSGQSTGLLLGQAKITLPAGTISYPLLEGERDSWKYQSGSFDLMLTNKMVKAVSDFSLVNGDHLHAEITLPEANLLTLDTQKQTLNAKAQLNVTNLDIIEAIVPDIEKLQAEVKVDFTATGTLAQPNINGSAELNNGTLNIPVLGLKIDKINFNATSDRLDKLNFTLNAHSGDGNIDVQGQTIVDSKNGWPTEINIKGERFTVTKTPEAHVVISPDLQAKIQHHNINITGKVDIPFADLKPKDMTSADKVSNDVVIIGGEQALEEQWLITTKIRLTLGDKISFYGFGFEGKLKGSLLLEDEPGQLTKATGEITVPEGRYRAYGQRLDVETGRIIFTGGPVTNPGLDLRAVRRINDITAGVLVRGTITEPQIDLFSKPSMGQTDMLSYLILGRPLETSTSEEGAMMAKAALALSLSGGDKLARSLGDKFGFDEMRIESNDTGDQTSLAVGRYLSPKLYVSYGVGLIESINTLNVRYQISNKWQIKAESGEAQGADIFYTIER